MTPKSGEQHSSHTSGRLSWRLFTLATIIWTLIVFLIVAGALFPRLPVLGVIGTVVESFFSLHLVLAALAGLALALLARRRAPNRAASFAVVCALLATSGSLIPFVALVRSASQYGAQISWLDHLHVTARFASAPSN
jgi:ABC-type transport system involved in multi-copper enzyme maturation permease subunit